MFSEQLFNVYVQIYSAKLLNSGCCGMAGSFGYEKEHYDISIKIAKQSLGGKIESSECVSANGTSCRHQIKDVFNKNSFHPASILLEALKK